MSYFEDLCRAEAELAWYFNDAETLLGIGAQSYDPDSHLGGGTGWDYKDRQHNACARSRPIRRVLAKCRARTRVVLWAGFFERSYVPKLAVDYLSPYGPKLAGIVLEFKPRGEKADKLATADAWRSEALREYIDVGRAA